MHFDDRLATVLRHRASGDRAARTQFRQLLDLLGSKPAGASGGRDEKMLAAAWLRLGALGENIPATERAAMLREPGLRFRNPELAAHLAEDEPEVALAALNAANLSTDDWGALIPRLPIRARGFLRLRRDLSPQTKDLLEQLGIHDRGLPVPINTDASDEGELANASKAPASKVAPPIPANDLTGATADAPDDESEELVEETTAIGALVKRIDAFRQARKDSVTAAGSANGSDLRLPLGEEAEERERAELDGFAFTANVGGRIDWAEQSVAPMVVGTLLNRQIGAIARKCQPIAAMHQTLVGSDLIAGDWIVDAQPRFTKPDGRFYGYAGMFRRAAQAYASDQPEAEQSSEADRLRQLLHELRTPVNAIQGFSEVIQQQLFGPTPHEYRALAATIAGDSARMLAGFDELDRLARLETASLEMEIGESDFASIVTRHVEQLQSILTPKTAEMDLTTAGVALVGLDTTEAEGLSWRILATLAGNVGAGEHISAELAEHGGLLRLAASLPLSLAATDDVFAASAHGGKAAVSAGMFGSGFSLRLARAEARMAGGDLSRVDDWLLLTLPLLTNSAGEPSQTGAGNAA